MQQDYARKARILRRIMSNKAAHYKRMNTGFSIATVVIASLVTFIGFYGVDRFYSVLNGSIFPAVSLEVFSFIFNLVTFLLVVLIFVQIFFRYGERQSEAERAIVSLSSFINMVRDKSISSQQPGALSVSDLELARERYESIISQIPANTDAEYEKARKERQDGFHDTPFLFLQSLGQPDEERKMLERIIRENKSAMSILSAARGYRSDLWIAGGVFRNLVWDRLHAYEIFTPIDDIDVIYFDPKHTDISVDRMLESELNSRSRGNDWSVKNQARMHVHNKEHPYSSLEDAISKFPETCTAFAIRQLNDDELEFLTPHGLSDLFCMIVRPTPHFESRASRIMERVEEKEWLKKWPRVRLILNHKTP